MEKYIKTHYTAPRMVVVGTGAIDHDELVKLTEAAFKDLPTQGVSTKDAITSDQDTSLRFRSANQRRRYEGDELLRLRLKARVGRLRMRCRCWSCKLCWARGIKMPGRCGCDVKVGANLSLQ